MNKTIAHEIDTQTAWFERNMLRITKQLRNRLNSMLNKFDRSGGKLLDTPENIQRISQIYGSITKELQAAGYAELITELNKKENDLLKLMKSSRISGAVPIAFTETSREALTAFNAMWNIEFGGIADDTARQIVGIVGDSIFGTQKIDTVIQRIADNLDNKFARYATTYANTSRARFIQAAIYANAKTYEGDPYWVYEGPEDDVTRPICRIGTGMDADASYPNAPYFTDEERIRFESESADLREYNCRHSFMQITEEYYIKHTR